MASADFAAPGAMSSDAAAVARPRRITDLSGDMMYAIFVLLPMRVLLHVRCVDSTCRAAALRVMRSPEWHARFWSVDNLLRGSAPAASVRARLAAKPVELMWRNLWEVPTTTANSFWAWQLGNHWTAWDHLSRRACGLGYHCELDRKPLHNAIAHGAPDDVVLALVEGWQPPVKNVFLVPDGLLRLPLHLAARRPSSPKVVAALLHACPAAVRVRDDMGCLPLHCIALRGFAQQTFEDKMADLIARGHATETDLDAATDRIANGETEAAVLREWERFGLNDGSRELDRCEVARLLVAAWPGARNERAKNGDTPLRIAMGDGANEQMLTILTGETPCDVDAFGNPRSPVCGSNSRQTARKSSKHDYLSWKRRSATVRYILGGGTGAFPSSGFPEYDIEMDDAGRLVGVTPSVPPVLSAALVEDGINRLAEDDVVAEEDTTVAIVADYLRRSFRGMVVEESALKSILVNDMECEIEDSGLIIF